MGRVLNNDVSTFFTWWMLNITWSLGLVLKNTNDSGKCLRKYLIKINLQPFKCPNLSYSVWQVRTIEYRYVLKYEQVQKNLNN